jgi:hypothetical protein
MRLALEDIYMARWTNQIHKEWIRNLLENRSDLNRAQLERTRDLMNQHVRDCLVTDYEDLIPSLTLPDPDDRHVLAAAIKANADVIVTFNLVDFPDQVLSKYGMEAQHPDDFLVHQFDLSPASVCRAVKKQRDALKNPAKSVDELLDILSHQQLPLIVSRLRGFAAML